MSTIVFLGGGRITSAMLAGLRLAKSKHRFVVHDRNPGKLRHLSKQFAVAVERNLEIVPRSQWRETTIGEGDRLEVVQFVGGGRGSFGS